VFYTAFSEFIEAISRIAVEGMMQENYHILFPTPFSKVRCLAGTLLSGSVDVMTRRCPRLSCLLPSPLTVHVLQILAMLTAWGLADLKKLEDVKAIHTLAVDVIN
jgi:hypothetical protein